MTHPDPFNGKSPAEILAIYQRYRSGESVRVLLDELGFDEVADSQFYRIFYSVRINELICPFCTNAPMLAKLPSKTNQIARIPHICQNCGHTVLSDFEGSTGVPATDCKCKGCSEAKKKQQESLEQSFSDKIRKAYKVQRALSCHDIDEVSLAGMIGLHALVNTWAAEDMTHLRPLQEKLELFWPIQSKSISSVSAIYHMDLLQVDFAHCTTAAFVEKTDASISWYTKSAALIPSIQKADGCCMDIPETMGYLASLIPVNLSNQQKSELLTLMLDIAVHECIQYFQNQLNEHGFDSDLGEKTEKMFEELLEGLPVNQILPCIWAAVKGAAAFLLTPGCNGRKHAFNSIQGKLRDAALRRISGESELKGFERNKYNPRSEISFSLYGLLGFDSDVGFKTRLKDIPIPNEWELDDSEDFEPDFEYASFTDEELTVMESHGFEVFHGFDATRRLPYSEHEIQVFKIQAASLYFEMSVSVGVDSECFKARLTTLDALLVYLGAFEKCNQLAEMLGE